MSQLDDYMRGAESLGAPVRVGADGGPPKMDHTDLYGRPQVQRAQVPWTLSSVIDREDKPHSFEELNADLDVRLDALRRGRTDWGCAGAHHGRYTARQIEAGAPNCPQWRHHHHDAFCREPSDMELRLAEVEKPEHGWGSRA